MKALAAEFNATRFEDETAHVLEPQVVQIWRGPGDLDIEVLLQDNPCARLENGHAYLDGPGILLTHSVSLPEALPMSICVWRLHWSIHGLKKSRVYRVKLKKD